MDQCNRLNVNVREWFKLYFRIKQIVIFNYSIDSRRLSKLDEVKGL